MRNVLLACKQLSFNFDEEGDLAASESGEPQIHTPINTTRSRAFRRLGQQRPIFRLQKKMAQAKRDCEYTRHGTLALLAAIDLVTGKAHRAA